jgi:hypothetical protein
VGGEAAALTAVTMAMTDNNQQKGAAEETMAAATVTGSGNDCDNGNNGSGNNGSSDDSGCGDGDGNTNSGSGGIDGGNCDSKGIVVAMVKAMAAAMVATKAVTAMAGGTDNKQLKGARKKQRQRQQKW